MNIELESNSEEPSGQQREALDMLTVLGRLSGVELSPEMMTQLSEEARRLILAANYGQEPVESGD